MVGLFGGSDLVAMILLRIGRMRDTGDCIASQDFTGLAFLLWLA